MRKIKPKRCTTHHICDCLADEMQEMKIQKALDEAKVSSLNLQLERLREQLRKRRRPTE